ncbi:hypothetical protein JCM24511_02115 [Saitozyma sp. JCM 24511]|nr:hypothetical protein JCM24511_02115 [Saitozyma sp. JCM 24511]
MGQSPSPVEDRRVLAEPLGYVQLVGRVEHVAKVERQGTVQSTVDWPYHRLNPTPALDTKLVWQQEIKSIGAPNDRLGHQPVDHVPHGNGAEAPVCLSRRAATNSLSTVATVLKLRNFVRARNNIDFDGSTERDELEDVGNGSWDFFNRTPKGVEGRLKAACGLA